MDSLQTHHYPYQMGCCEHSGFGSTDIVGMVAKQVKTIPFVASRISDDSLRTLVLAAFMAVAFHLGKKAGKAKG